MAQCASNLATRCPSLLACTAILALLDLQNGVIFNTTWADICAPIHLIGAPHIGHGQHHGSYSNVHHNEHMVVATTVVLARDFLLPHADSASSTLVALNLLESAPVHQVKLNEALFSQLHDEESWRWLQGTFEILSWADSLGPGDLLGKFLWPGLHPLTTLSLMLSCATEGKYRVLRYLSAGKTLPPQF
ncbi:hypothetical protein FB451DRAFT_1167166 [Mycena latifolia]|nr:hypothetical protein FB451DRAFT_1167166 [Mycena latifolia]